MLSQNYLFLLLVISTATTTYVNGAVTEQQKKDIVVTHNKYRCMHGLGQENFLEWSNCVAAPAQAHANKGVFGHSDSYDRTGCAGPAGENIAGGHRDPQSAIKDFYDEYTKYYVADPNDKRAAHFTALIWKDAGFIGAGINEGKKFYVFNYRGADNGEMCRTPNYRGCYESQVNKRDTSKTEAECEKIALEHYNKSEGSDSDGSSDDSTDAVNSSVIVTSSVVLVSMALACLSQLF